MQYVPMMDCGDGIRRAEVASAFSGVATEDKTAAYTIKPTDSGKFFTNRGAGGSVTFTGPATADLKPGMCWRIFKVANQTVVFTAGSGTTVNGAAGLTNSTGGETNAQIEIVAISVTELRARTTGTWA